MTAQDRALDAISKMSKTASIDDMIEKLNFIKDVEEGFGQIEAGAFLTHDEVKASVAKWLTK